MYNVQNHTPAESSSAASVLIAKIDITPAPVNLLKTVPGRLLRVSRPLKISRLLKTTTITSSGHYSTDSPSSSSPCLASLLLRHHILYVHCCFIGDTQHHQLPSKPFEGANIGNRPQERLQRWETKEAKIRRLTHLQERERLLKYREFTLII